MKNIMQIGMLTSCLVLSACGERASIEVLANRKQEGQMSSVHPVVCRVEFLITNGSQFRLNRITGFATFDSGYGVPIDAQVGAGETKTVRVDGPRMGEGACAYLIGDFDFRVDQCNLDQHNEGECKDMVASRTSERFNVY